MSKNRKFKGISLRVNSNAALVTNSSLFFIFILDYSIFFFLKNLPST